MNQDTPIYSTLDDACRACGVEPREARGVGFVATNVDGSRHGRGAGRIKFFSDNSGGYVKNWTDGRDALFFYGYRQGTRIPREEWLARMAELKQARVEDEKRRRQIQASVSEMAAEILATARPATDLHPYLMRKRVAGIQGAPCYEISGGAAQAIVDRYPPADDGKPQKLDYLGPRLLVIPMTIQAPAPASLQLISACGKKSFLKGGRVKGTVWRPTDLPAQSADVTAIGLAEGVATALSVRSMFGVPCAAGISAGNLIHAARTLRTAYPKAEIQIFADRDASGTGEAGARAAACAVTQTKLFLCPEFSAVELARYRARTGGNSPSDFNDLMISREANR